ncbi:hypothetical protein [Hyphomicrobium sp.]|uniref:hypothetical protein n=1 Tax=Hyphomicrobium sp. TaxID=82 RepID=UPI002E37A17E|nr:hypothetical protein [Hyphomicrobium sp.]HEX2842167.1 hypothetical protein [Hyphomicrobium sp.]
MRKSIMPPARQFQRARSRRTFNRLFQPLHEGHLHEVIELPPTPDEHHWWTCVDLEPDGQRLYLLPGIRFANRLGFVQTEHAWGGDADLHPPYVY